MFTYDTKNIDKTTTQYTITVPHDEITNRYDKHLKERAGEVKLEGFRKGKAPSKLSEKQVPKEKVYDDLIQQLMRDIYVEILKKYNLKPVVAPKVDLKKATEKEDWIIEFQIAERPQITLPDYKAILKDVKGNLKKSDIWTPGKTKDITDEDSRKKRDTMLNNIFNALLDKTDINISPLILEHEIDTRLTALLDDVQKIGLTMEGYLKSKNITKDDIKKQYEKEIIDVYKLEFLLQGIGDQEKITVDKAELDTFLGTAKNDQEKKQISDNMYFYSGVLRKQKVINFLLDES